MNKAFQKVKEFHETLDHPIGDAPQQLETSRLWDRAYLVAGELRELEEATTLVDQVDAIMDSIYLLIGTLVEMGIEPEECFNIVHRANMKKLFPDGKPRYREDGKIVKPPGWETPEPLLEIEIERQLEVTRRGVPR